MPAWLACVICALPQLLPAAVSLPAPLPDEAPSPLYRVTVDGQPVFVHALQVRDNYRPDGTVHGNPPGRAVAQPTALCRFDCTGRVTIEVQVLPAARRAALTAAIIRPLAEGIKATVAGDRITFTLDAPATLSVEPNGLAWGNLHIIARRPPAVVPRKGDPGITHFYGPGEHVVGEVRLAAGARVYLAPGAVVRGHLIGQAGADDIRIFGRSILDASKAPGRFAEKKTNAFGRYQFLIQARGSSGLEIKGITLIDSPKWAMQIIDCDAVRIRDVTVFSWRENGDGIDICNSHDVRVRGGFLRVSDDALLCKGLWVNPDDHSTRHLGVNDYAPDVAAKYRHSPPCHDVRFEDCVVWLDRAHALHVGLPTATDEMYDIAFADIDIIHDADNAALEISSGDRAHIHHVAFRDIRIEDSRSDRLIGVQVGRVYTSGDKRTFGLDWGPITDISFENITATCRTREGKLAPATILLQAKEHNSASHLDRIHFKNLIVNGEIITDAKQVRLQSRGRVRGVTFDEADGRGEKARP